MTDKKYCDMCGGEINGSHGVILRSVKDEILDLCKRCEMKIIATVRRGNAK